MSEDSLRYDRLVEDALRSVVGRALSHVAKHGLPGDHHFYITFRTDHPGVTMPERLRERYPSEMTIVLQHQFWDLKVHDDGFAITLSFSDVPQRLTIPFDALVAFADPSVRFGLQFDVGEDEKPAIEDAQTVATSEGPSLRIVDEAEPATDKVVTLDTFRKK